MLTSTSTAAKLRNAINLAELKALRYHCVMSNYFPVSFLAQLVLKRKVSCISIILNHSSQNAALEWEVKGRA